MPKKNYYELLGIKPNDEISRGEIGKTFWQIVEKLRNDNNLSKEEKKERLREVNEACSVLTIFREKRRYDACPNKENFHPNEILKEVQLEIKTREDEIEDNEDRILRMTDW